MKWRIEILVLAAAVMSGCASSPYGGRTPLFGMVYNMDRAPVGDVLVRVLRGDSVVDTTLSDIRGRFSLPDVPLDEITLELTKDSYEPVVWRFRFQGPSQVVYMKMENGSQLLAEASTAIEKRDWAAASAFLDRADKLAPRSRETRYLRGVILADQGKPSEAAALWETLSDGGTFAIEVSLADLYQYKLDDKAKALTHLQRALGLRKDIDLEQRVADLQASGS